jgi:hypothetical protein
LNGTENTAIVMSVAAKFIRYFLKSTDVFFFLTRIMTAEIFVTKAIKAVPPYSRAKIDGKGSGSANNSDKFAVELYVDRFAEYSSFKAKIGSIL